MRPIEPAPSTLTSSPFWEYPDGKTPFVGALRPRGTVETTRVAIMPFGAISEEMACAYGEVSGRLTGGVGRILST